MLTINIRQKENVQVLDLQGKLLADSDFRLWAAVQDLVVEKGARNLLINFSDVSVCDSYGIGELLRLHAALTNMDGKIVLFGVNKLIGKVFDITHVSEVLHIQGTEKEALASLFPLVLVD